MAKQIEDIIVKLGLQGFEGLDKIRSSFRDLSKVTQMSDKDITSARDALFDFAKTAGNTEAVNKGLISAFQGLRTQADICGDAYAELSRDIENLEAVSRGYTAQAAAQRVTLAAQYGAITNNTEALRRQRTALIELQQATRGGSQLFTQLGTDIQRTTARLDELDGIQRRTNATLNRGLPSSSVKIRRDLQDVRDRISIEREELERLQTLTAEERKQFRQGTELRGQSGVTRAIAEQERVLATFRQQAGALDLSENVRQRREAVRDANALFMSPEFTGTGSRTPDGLTRSFGELPNTIAGISQGLSELRTRLDNVTIGTTAFVDAAVRAAAAQRELKEATQGVAAAFVQQLRAGEIAPSLTNLREVISSVRTEQGMLDTSSTSGARAFQLLERQARSLERQLSALQTTQASLAATPASGFAAFSQSITPQAGDTAIQGAVRRNRAKQERERRRLEREAAQFFSEQPTLPLLLPAAGQTSAPGTGLNISGGPNVRAGGQRRSVTDVGGNIPVMGVRPGSGVQRFFGSADIGAAALYPGAVPIGPRATSRQEGENRSAVIAEKDARLANSAAIEDQRKRMESLRAAVATATATNTGSINSLGKLREALANLRNEIPATNGEFKQLTNRLQDVDVRSERLSTRASRRLSGMQLAQGVGAALSGGIFGGPEGLIGGLGGLAVGGVGGAFAGAAFGAQAGMFRQQLAAVTEYSARIDKLQIALRGIVGSQDAYSQALAAAASVTRDLNIPQETAIQGMTRLSAAVQGAGGTVSDSAFAFRAVSEAVKATGGNAEQADGALLALTQVFSKGKVSAEELNQIAERLPGTFTLFAKAAGKSGPELQKALQQGEVGLNDLMKFLQLISSTYGKTAMKVAASSQEAGARLSVAMKNMQLDVGRALQPVGALLQSAFTEFIRSTTPALVLSAKLIGGGITNMYNAFASGIKTLITLRGVFENLAKTMLVFGGITAGVFVASNITTFTNALKGALVVLRTMLSVEKAMLVVENARIAAQAILVSITSGAGKGKIIGAGVGALAGIGAVVGIGKLVESVVGDIEKGLSGALKGVDLKIPELTKFSTPSVEADKETKKAAKDREKAEEEALRKQTSINRLLQEQLRLNYEAGAIDADALGKLEAEEALLKQIIRLKINEVTLTSKTKEERELGIINLSTEFTKENKRISTQRAAILEEIKGLGADIKKEWRGLTDTFIQESPVQAGIRRFEEARAVFVENRDKEMKQLREKAGLRPEGAAKLAELGGAKAAAAAITPRQVRSVVSKQILQDDITSLQNDIRSLESGANTMGTLGEIMQRHSAYWKELDEGQRQYIANLAEIKDSLRFMQDARIGTGLKEGAQAYVQSIGTMREATAQLAQTGIKGVEDAIFSLVTTGTANFREFAASILKDTARMIIQQMILRSVMQIIGAVGGGGASASATSANYSQAQMMTDITAFPIKTNALGNAFAANGIVPFAMGGLVDRPTLFKFANGGAGRLGLMGEAGPEAIMPLRRLPSGRLGVEAAGGSHGNNAPISVTVHVDANGTSVQGDAGQGEQLGRVISQAVQAELVRQKRPGGLLAA